ncbi:MAG: amino acid permease [Methanoregulaceae archaeon]
MAGTQPGLRRELGFFEVTVSGVGVILGAGVYALLGSGAALAGNAVWLAFGISAIIAAFTGLSYAELSSLFPRAGAEYEYVDRAFGERTAFTIGFLIILSGIFAAATVALGFSGYFSALSGLPQVPVAAVLILLLCILLLFGIRETALFAIVFTLIEAGGLIFLIAVGLPHLGSVDYLEMPQGWTGVFQASALLFFAYTGFEGIVKLSEETKNSEQTIPRALLFSLAITIILYILVALSAVSVGGWQLVSGSDAPFTSVIQTALGSDASYAIGIVALFATANTALMFLLASSRITFGMASGGSLPGILSRVWVKRGTPWAAVILVSGVALLPLAFQDISVVASITNATLFITFIAINAALIVLRFRCPAVPRPFRVPFSVRSIPVLPVCGILFSLFLLAQQEILVLVMCGVLAGIGLLVSYRTCFPQTG